MLKAKKREVAVLSGNFRGACPDLIRSKGFAWVFAVCVNVGNTRARVKVSENLRHVEIQGNHALLDQSAAKIVETAKKTGADVSGPIPLPTEREVVTIIRAVHKYKDSREQFEQRTHKRLIDITNATLKTTDALTKLDLPAGVDIEIKL